MERGIRLTKASIGRWDRATISKSDMRPGGDRRWRVCQRQGRFVAEELDEETVTRVNAPILRRRSQEETLETELRNLEDKLSQARLRVKRSRAGLRSLFTTKRRREELESQVSTLEKQIISLLEAKGRMMLERNQMGEQGWHRISFRPHDKRLWDKSVNGYWGIAMYVYMRPSVYEKAEALQKEEPIYLGTWFPRHSQKMEGKFWWCRDKFWISTGCSEEEARLLLWERGRREQRKFERLAKAKTAADQALEEPRREMIPEEVRLLVWERDGGQCVKCGSTEDLEFDHIIPVSKGGSNTEKNVQLLCATCNREKRDRIG